MNTYLATKADLIDLRADLKTDIRVLKWMVGLVMLVEVVPTLVAFLNLN